MFSSSNFARFWHVPQADGNTQLDWSNNREGQWITSGTACLARKGRRAYGTEAKSELKKIRVLHSREKNKIKNYLIKNNIFIISPYGWPICFSLVANWRHGILCFYIVSSNTQRGGGTNSGSWFVLRGNWICWSCFYNVSRPGTSLIFQFPQNWDKSSKVWNVI